MSHVIPLNHVIVFGEAFWRIRIMRVRLSPESVGMFVIENDAFPVSVKSQTDAVERLMMHVPVPGPVNILSRYFGILRVSPHPSVNPSPPGVRGLLATDVLRAGKLSNCQSPQLPEEFRRHHMRSPDSEKNICVTRASA